MRNIFSKINLKLLNAAAWITVVLAYILPFSTDGSVKRVGFPFAYLTVYDAVGGRSLLSSFHIQAVVLLIDIAAVYAIMVCIAKISAKIKGIKDKR